MTAHLEPARVVSVSTSPRHGFSKPPVEEIVLVEGWGVEGDAHAGTSVQHLSRIRREPTAPNLRQVHLIHSELFDELAGHGYEVVPGALGENVTTRGIDLLGLATGTLLRLGAEAVVEVTGLRNPCTQIDGLQDGLMKHTVGRDEHGAIVRKAGVMAVVLAGGVVRAGDGIRLESPAMPHRPLLPV